MNSPIERRWWLTEYAHEIHEVLREKEFERIFYENNLPQKMWRMHLFSFMLDISDGLEAGTFHLAVYFMDAYLDKYEVEVYDLHLIAVTAMRIACKFDDKKFKTELLELPIQCLFYGRRDYRRCEMKMIAYLKWNFTLPTAHTFCSYYAEYVVDENDYRNFGSRYGNYEAFRDNFIYETQEILNKTLYDTTLQYKSLPSRLAAMCLVVIRSRNLFIPIWPYRLAILTQYSYEHLITDLDLVLNIIRIPGDVLADEISECIREQVYHDEIHERLGFDLLRQKTTQ